MKYVCVAAPMLFGSEVISWICLAVMAIMFIADLTLKVEQEREDRWQ